MNFADGQISNQKEDANVSKTLPRSLRYRSFNDDLRSAPSKRSHLKTDSDEILRSEGCLNATSDNEVASGRDHTITDLVPDFNLG